ncbi:2-oxoacid:acceptor oxidoreductase family protein [Halobacteriaceae archaeon GCM10025711]
MSAALDMTQIRWHSRGGQGGMTASQLLAEASFEAGREATAFSFYGAERRGAPITSFNRVSDEPIKLYSQVSAPDIVVVLDESLVDMEDVTAGLDEDGILVINTDEPDRVAFDGRVVAVDATDIALAYDLQADGTPIVNTPMLGAVARTGLVDVDTVATVVEREFGEANMQAVRAAYERAEEV